MCGFAGIFSKEGLDNNYNNIVKNMTSELSHRGPDEENFFKDPFISLGFNRLSIIDIKNGSQPKVSLNKKFIICFNGEIYNYKKLQKELRNKNVNLKTDSDTEVFLEMFSVYGANCLDKIRGMFAAVIYDVIEKKIFLLRDRFGMKPLFYSILNDKIIFSSEISPIINSKILKKKINYASINSYLSFRYHYGEDSFFSNVHNLEPGTFLEFKNNSKISKYWEIPKFDKNKFLNLKENNFLEKLEDIFNECINDHLVSDVPIGGLLSGGLDSSLLMSLVKKNSNQSFETFSAKFSEENYDESHYAKIVANQLKLNHNDITLNDNDYIDLLPKLISLKKTPLSIPHEIALFNLFKEIKKKTKVVISGEGADEIFGGYGRVQSSAFDFKKETILNNLIFKKKSLSDFFIKRYSWIDIKEKENIFSKEFYESINRNKRIEVFWESEFKKISDLDPYDQFLHIFQKHHLKCLLDRLDYMSMASGVEARTPFVDHKLINFVNSIPFNLKFKWKSKFDKFIALFSNSIHNSEKRDVSKYILRQYAKKYLPEQIVNRKKLGFPVPLDQWLNNKRFFKFVKEILLDHKTISRGIFEKKTIEKLISNDQKLDYDFWGKKIWMLLNIELWFRELEK